MMRGIVDHIAREDIKPFISRVVLAVGVPLALLATKSEPATPSSSSSYDVVAKSSTPDQFVAGKCLKDELCLQQNEENLLSIIHGVPTTLSRQENLGRKSPSYKEEFLLPEPSPRHSKDIDCSTDENKEKVEELNQHEVAHFSQLVLSVFGDSQEKVEKKKAILRALVYHEGSQEEEKTMIRKLESTFSYIYNEKNLSSLELQSSCEGYRPEAILAPGQSKPAMMIEYSKMEPSKLEKMQAVAAGENKMLLDQADFATIYRIISSNLEKQHKLDLVPRLEFLQTVSSSSTSNTQKVEMNHVAEEKGQMIDMIDYLAEIHSFRKLLRVYQPQIDQSETTMPNTKRPMLKISGLYPDEKNKICEDAEISHVAFNGKCSSTLYGVASMTEEKDQQTKLKHVYISPDELSRSYKEVSTEACSSSTSADHELGNSTFDVSSIAKDAKYSRQSKGHKWWGLQLLAKLKKQMLGKQRRQKRSSGDEASSRRGSSQTEESVSSRISNDNETIERRSRKGDPSHLPFDKQWQGANAWLQTGYATRFDTAGGKLWGKSARLRNWEGQ